MIKIAALVALSVSLSGCMAHYEKQLRSETSGRIGCPQEEIKLIGRKYHFTNQTWTAECRGNRYFCTQATVPPYNLSCAKEEPAK